MIRRALILILFLSGCVSGPQIADWNACHGKATSEDVALIQHWTEQLETGQLTLSEFRFLVDGRLEVH